MKGRGRSGTARRWRGAGLSVGIWIALKVPGGWLRTSAPPAEAAHTLSHAGLTFFFFSAASFYS